MTPRIRQNLPTRNLSRTSRFAALRFSKILGIRETRVTRGEIHTALIRLRMRSEFGPGHLVIVRFSFGINLQRRLEFALHHRRRGIGFYGELAGDRLGDQQTI